jgi:hypothetical protein
MTSTQAPYANAILCRQLCEAFGWDQTFLYWQLPRKSLGTNNIRFHKTGQLDLNKTVPAYDVSFMIEKALELRFVHVKFKLCEQGGICVTSPPHYHMHDSTTANALAKLLLLKNSKIKRIEVK